MTTAKKNTASKELIKTDSQHMKVFAKHRHYYDFFMATGEMVNFHHEVQAELLVAYRAEFDVFYDYQKTCPACVAEFLTLIYRQYENRK